MSATKLPKQTTSPDGSYSPVVLAESPAASVSQRNLTGLPRVARDIAADIYNNIQQWNTLHINGAGIIKEIALLKSDTKKLYPDGLESLVNTLMEIVNGLKIIVNSLESCAQQLKSLIELHKSPAPLFISWPTEKMSEVGCMISEAYSQECKLKEFILENVSHIQGKDKLMFYAASWTYQPYITHELSLNLESFLTETGHRNKN